jgi:excisionase family DNA binding protein
MQLMSIEDLAVYLGDSKRTIYKYIASGDCPPYIKISGKNIKFDRADVDGWLESKKVAANPEPDGQTIYQIPFPTMARARKVMKIAQRQANERKLDYVGTEHLLAGIIAVEDCIGAIVLKNLGFDTAKFDRLYNGLCKETQDRPEGDTAGLMNTAQMAVRCAKAEAIRYGHTYIGTEHLLGAIFHISGGSGYQILTQLDITLEDVRSQTAKLLVCQPEQKTN